VLHIVQNLRHGSLFQKNIAKELQIYIIDISFNM